MLRDKAEQFEGSSLPYIYASRGAMYEVLGKSTARVALPNVAKITDLHNSQQWMTVASCADWATFGRFKAFGVDI